MAQVGAYENYDTFTQNTIKGLESAIKASQKADSLEIIAFYDPNDIMNYKLPETSPDKTKNLSIKNVEMNIAPGISANKRFLFKYAKRIDRYLRRLIKCKSKGLLYSGKEKKVLKRYYAKQQMELLDSTQIIKQLRDSLKITEKNLNEIVKNQFAYYNDKLDSIKSEKRKILLLTKRPLILPHLLKVLEIGNEKGNRANQTFVFRYDIAHEGAKHDPQTIRLITHGTAGARKTDPTLTFPRQFEKDSRTRRINTATPIKPK